MTPSEQLERWVLGESVHNPERDECCPDFSCCRSMLLWGEEQRKEFRDRPDLRDGMLMMSLGALLCDSNVHVTGFQEA